MVVIALFIPIFIFLFFYLAPKLPLNTTSQETVIQSAASQPTDSYIYVRYIFLAFGIIGCVMFVVLYIRFFVFMPIYAKSLNPYKLKEE